MRFLAFGAALGLALGAGAQETRSTLSGAALINHHVRAKWEEAGLKPAAKASDAEFVRRVYLDVVGVIPSAAEAEKFLGDKAADKRAKLVGALVKDPRYATHWADVWSGVIIGFDNDNRDQVIRFKATDEIRDMLSKNVPHDEFARRIITVSGNVLQRPPAMMMRGGDDKDAKVQETGLAGYLYNIQREAGRDFPLALAGKLSRAFMGVQIQCAQCHDHPFDRWTQEEFYGMASFFTEIRGERHVLPSAEGKDRKDLRQQDYYIEITDARRGPRGRAGGGRDLSIPDSKAGPIKPSFLVNGKGVVEGEPRRTTFAKYVTEPENVQFAKMQVNRIWAHFFGAGFVNPVDDFNEKNRPTHPELLEALAKDFIAHKYDTHWLIQAVVNSEPYQLTSRSSKDRDPQAEKYLALARVRSLGPEQILRSMIEATDVGQGPAARMAERARDAKVREMAKMGRERQIFRLLTQFRSNFGDDEGNEVVDFAGTIPSALLMMNSPEVGAATTLSRGGPLGELLSKHATPEARIKAVYMAVLTRTPSDKELSRWKSHATRHGDKAYEDLMWTLLNTSEFLFNH